MLRIFRLMLLLGAFVGGYYLGRLPNSPDIIGYAKDACHTASTASAEISARAKADGTSVPKAAVAYFQDMATKKVGSDAAQRLGGAQSTAASTVNAEEYR